MPVCGATVKAVLLNLLLSRLLEHGQARTIAAGSIQAVHGPPTCGHARHGRCGAITPIPPLL